MPGDPRAWAKPEEKIRDANVKKNTAQLIKDGTVTEDDVNSMVKSILRTSIAMGWYDRPVKDVSLIAKMPEHEKVALQTARESIVLLKNENQILPLSKRSGKILLTGDFVETLARGLGSAEVLGYNIVSMLDAMKQEFGEQLEFVRNPSDQQIAEAGVILLSVGTLDSEGWDKPFEQPEIEKRVLHVASLNPKTIVIVNTGGGVSMTKWNSTVAGIIYLWDVGKN
jgi:beta-glucosidase